LIDDTVSPRNFNAIATKSKFLQDRPLGWGKQ